MRSLILALALGALSFSSLSFVSMATAWASIEPPIKSAAAADPEVAPPPAIPQGGEAKPEAATNEKAVKEEAPKNLGVMRVGIVPHRAIYDMSFVPTSHSSQVTGANGRMLFAWGDACTGWTVEQKMQMKFSYASGEVADITSTLATFEAKDGSSYRFNVRRQQNGVETEAFSGDAKRDGKKITAHFTQPEDRDEKLPDDTLFPSAHTLLILKKAAEGETIVNRTVFDGSDLEGTNEINAVTLPGNAALEASDTLPEKMIAGPHWSFRMAFFPLKDATESPDYEMTIDLNLNGVARHIMLDYGDFRISGTLRELEALPGC